MDCFARTLSVARNDVKLLNPPCVRQINFHSWQNAICSPIRFPFVAKCHASAGLISARGKMSCFRQLDFGLWQNAICSPAHFLPVAALRQNLFRGIIALTDASLAPETFFQAKSGKLWTTYLTTQNLRSSRLRHECGLEIWTSISGRTISSEKGGFCAARLRPTSFPR